MTNPSFPKDHSIDPAQNAPVTDLFPDLEDNPVLEQVLPLQPLAPEAAYQAVPLKAPAIVDQEQLPSINPSSQPRKISSASGTHTIKYAWLLVIGAAIVALIAISDLRMRHSAPIPHTIPSRIPRTGSW
jgi:hypothetical protein